MTGYKLTKTQAKQAHCYFINNVDFINVVSDINGSSFIFDGAVNKLKDIEGFEWVNGLKEIEYTPPKED